MQRCNRSCVFWHWPLRGAKTHIAQPRRWNRVIDWSQCSFFKPCGVSCWTLSCDKHILETFLFKCDPVACDAQTIASTWQIVVCCVKVQHFFKRILLVGHMFNHNTIGYTCKELWTKWKWEQFLGGKNCCLFYSIHCIRIKSCDVVMCTVAG